MKLYPSRDITIEIQQNDRIYVHLWGTIPKLFVVFATSGCSNHLRLPLFNLFIFFWQQVMMPCGMYSDVGEGGFGVRGAGVLIKVEKVYY